MASFSDRLKAATQNSGIAMAAETSNMVSEPSIMTLEETPYDGLAYSGETWTADKTNYRWFKDFKDDNYSTIDNKKTIILNDKEFNITQESNSQFIPFMMSRYYDGYDLLKANISIHYDRNDGSHGADQAVNVEYTDDKIRFAWKVDSNASAIAGKLKFEIHATGTISDNKGNDYAYEWKTRQNTSLEVLQSLCDEDCHGIINIDDTWVQELVTAVAQKVANQIANAQIGSQVTEAQNAANRAEVAANNAEQAVKNALNGYATETFVKDEIAKVDVSGQLVDYALKSEIPTKVSELENDNGYLTEHQDISGKSDVGHTHTLSEITDYKEPDLSNYATQDFVTQEIANADIEGKLGNYYKKDETYSKDEIDNIIEGIDVTEQLVDYAKSEDVYTKEEIDGKNYATQDSLTEIETSLGTISGNTVTNAENILKVQNDISEIQSSLNSLDGDNKDLIIQYDEVGSVLHLYEKDENGDIVVPDGDGEIKVKEIYSTIITGAGGGGSSLVSTVKLKLTQDGEESSTVLFGDTTYLNYNLSTRKAKEVQDESGNDVTIYEEAVIAGDITFTLYRDNVYLTHFTVTKTSPDVQSGSIDISDYIILGKQVFTIKATYDEKLGSDGESIQVRSSADWAINSVKLQITETPDKIDPTWESTPKYGSIAFTYTPIGALEKTIYFKIDDKKPETVVTLLNGTSLTYTIPKQTHGVHTLQVWCEANVGGTAISTEPYKYVLMFVETGNNTPIIRIKAPETLEQYSSANIYYNVFDPLNEVIKSVLIYDEEGVTLSSKENITSAEQKYEFRPSIVKDKVITIKYKEITESVSIKVTKFPYEISAVKGNLMVDFVPTGRTNSDVDYNVFKNNAYIIEKDSNTGEETQKEIPITWTFSNNFDWINGGWKTDENGDTYFCIKSGTSVDINYNLFGTDGVVAKKDANMEYTIAGTGKEFKLIFKTTNVAKANTTWLSCVDVADKKSLGIRMEAQNAYIDSGLGTLEIPYVDNDIIEFDMNIVPMTRFLDGGEPNLKVKAIPMIMTYEDGTPVQPKVISSASTSFKQDTPKPITIGSEYCDVHIYRMKVYERYLEDKEIITNFIADARSGEEMAKRYLKNDIYPIEDKQKITPESVAAACPDLKVYVLSAPYFTNDKGNKVENTTIKQIHNTGTKEKPEYDASENWIATGATHNGQGTSSNEYGYSGRNLEFNLKKATITLNDNTTVVKEIQLSPTSYPTNYLNFKINIASSENANNALLQKRFDKYLPYTSLAALIDDRKKNSMEFFNCVVFIQETDENISTHREFGDTDIHFYGIGNIGDSKKTDASRVNDKNDVNEFCVEIMDWNRYLSSFPTDTMFSTIYTYMDGDVEKQGLRFEDLLIDSNLGEDGIIYEKDNRGNYYHSSDTTVDKTKTYYIDVLENDDFSEDYTYGFRYIQKEWKKDDDADYKAKNEAFQKPLRQKWIEFYRFVTRDLTTNGVEDAEKVKAWKSEFSDWFILDAALYYYLYTLRYTMADNRAKNTFWHWGKHYITFEEAMEIGIDVYDENKNLITDSSNLPSKFYDVNGKEILNINSEAAAINNGYRMDFWDYDNDTALGIDNAGKLEIPFGVEDDDVDNAGVPYFRAHDSLVFVRIAKYFTEELENMWHNTEINPIGKVFNATSFIDEFDSWQNQFPEELWRLDYERKYKRTYVGGTGNEWDNALPQSNQSDIVSTRFLTEMMNGRKKYQRRCFERNQEIYMSSKFKGEVNLGDTITLRGTGRPTDKVVSPNFTLNITPFSKMYINLYSATDKIYYHKKCEAGIPCEPIPYPETTLDFIYIRGASQIQSLGDLSPMYLQTAELTAGAKLKTITLGNSTNGYSNDSLKTLQIGAGNKLLEELDVRNLSNLDSTVLPVSNIPSLKRVYAQGSNISEVVFANNGLLEEAYLPATTTRLELRNLHYLKTLSLESYNNLLHLVVINCPSMNDIALDMINKSPDLKTLRMTNINWSFSDTSVLKKLYSLIKDFNSPEVVLSGKVNVSSVIKQKEYEDYRTVWSDLEISCVEVSPQYSATFLNTDGTILDVQYVDEGLMPVDPVLTNRIDTPIQIPTVEKEFTFTGWNKPFEQMFENMVFTATYSSSIREYTVKYVSEFDPNPLQVTKALYGSIVEYEGNIPTYNGMEGQTGGYRYYLFDHWDKSGYVNGDKTINAVFDVCRYTGSSYFAGREFNDLRPVEKYALLQLNRSGDLDISQYVDVLDELIFKMGEDYDFDEITSKLLVDDKVYLDTNESTVFTGNNYINTGISLMDQDRSFVLAVDFELASNNSNGATLMQCFDHSKTEGFRLSCNGSNPTTPTMYWTESNTIASKVGNREMIVLRHTQGEPFIHVYKSNLSGDSMEYVSLEHSSRTYIDPFNSALIFGCALNAVGQTTAFASGTIHWAKLWYGDLGDNVCRNIAKYTKEEIHTQMCGHNRKLLADGTGYGVLSFLATHTLRKKSRMNSILTGGTVGGWGDSIAREWLNTRFYDGLPLWVKQLIKPVKVDYIIGGSNSSTTSCNCNVFLPSVTSLSNEQTYSSSPYTNEEKAILGDKCISYMRSPGDRIRRDYKGDAVDYWTRSVYQSNTTYFAKITAEGKVYAFSTSSTELGLVVEFCM